MSEEEREGQELKSVLMRIFYPGLFNLVNTEVNLPVDGPTLGESHPEEAGQLREAEMVNIVTSPAHHPDQP